MEEIETQLTRRERIVKIMELIELGEERGEGELKIVFHNHQIVKIVLPIEEERWSNAGHDWYVSC